MQRTGAVITAFRLGILLKLADLGTLRPTSKETPIARDLNCESFQEVSNVATASLVLR